jgi:Nif-specific regulatory protein
MAVKALADRLAERRSKEIQKLSTLLQISQALAGTLDLKSALQEVLETLGRHHDALKSLIILQNRDTRELTVEASMGPGRPAQHGNYVLGEGVIGKVIETGKHVVISRMSGEPSLAAQMVSRQDAGGDEQSFFCLPITVDRQSVGAIGLTVKYLPDRNYDRTVKFFTVVASVIGQAAKVQRLVAAQHRRLVTENARL